MFPPFVENWLTLAIALLLLHVSMEIIDRFRFDPSEAEKTVVAANSKPGSKDVTSKYFPSPTKRGSVPPSQTTSAFLAKALEVGFKQSDSESKLPDIAEPEKLPEPTAQQYIHNMTDTLRFQCCLCNCPQLMQHAREKYGDAGTGGMTTTQVRAWLKRNPEHIPPYFQDTAYHIDHIIPDLCGGSLLNWPSNFMIVPKSVNLYFSSHVTAEKKKFVGKAGWQAAADFARWAGLKGRCYVPYGQFDPVGDHFLASRSR